MEQLAFVAVIVLSVALSVAMAGGVLALLLHVMTGLSPRQARMTASDRPRVAEGGEAFAPGLTPSTLASAGH
jgi:hypothetical protein